MGLGLNGILGVMEFWAYWTRGIMKFGGVLGQGLWNLWGIEPGA